VNPVVDALTKRYLEVVDEELPGRIEGLYLIGSVALDDFRPGHSDVDFVAVMSAPLSIDEHTGVTSAHERLSKQFRRPWFSGVYVTWADLQRDPRLIAAVPSYHEGHFKPSGGFDANPVQWLTLRTRPVAIRGAANPDVWTDPDAVREWVWANLHSYWAGWNRSQKRLFGPGVMTLLDWGVCWGVLGVTRLHFTLAAGGVTSKTGAGAYALDTFDTRWHPVIHEALRIRGKGDVRGDTLGRAARSYRLRRLARRRDALQFIDHVIESARPPEASR
jgi:hypothetical protein